MAWTKRQLIDAAFGELALAGQDFDISPEEYEAARRRLDTMMATWSAEGVRVGYAMGMPDSGDLDSDSGLQLMATEAVYLQLALRLAASKGKALAASTRTNAKAAYDALLVRIAHNDMREQQLPSTTPRGAGSKSWRTVNGPFMPIPDESPLGNSDDGGLLFNGN